MRKLKLQVQLSVDGYAAGSHDEMDWMTFNWDDKLKEYVNEITKSMDCIVLGRKLAEGFIPHWTAVAANLDDPEHTAGRKFTDTPKVVFTKTMDQSAWDNTELATGDLVDEIAQLKKQEGKDIIAYGGVDFVASLIEAGLVDEYHLLVNPVAIGQGRSIFESLREKQALSLVGATSFDSGIVALCYQVRSK